MKLLRFVSCVAALGVALLGAAAACSSFDADAEQPGADSTSDAPLTEVGPDDGAVDGAAADAASVRHHVYVYGGAVSAYRAEVLADATLGKWERYPALDLNRYAFANVDLPGAVLIAGGAEIDGGVVFGAAVQRALAEDGGFAPWQSQPSLPAGRDVAGGAASSKFAYVSGGLVQGSIATSDIQSALINPGGGVSSWKTAGALPSADYQHATTVLDETLYLVASSGGGAAGTTAAWSASLLPDGGLGAWTGLPAIPRPALLRTAIVTARRTIFLIGSRNENNGPVADVWSSTHDADGGLTGWAPNTPLPVRARSGVCAVVDRDVIYVFGGEFSVEVGAPRLADVAVGRIDQFGTVTWTALPEMPEARAGFGCAVR